MNEYYEEFITRKIEEVQNLEKTIEKLEKKLEKIEEDTQEIRGSIFSAKCMASSLNVRVREIGGDTYILNSKEAVKTYIAEEEEELIEMLKGLFFINECKAILQFEVVDVDKYNYRLDKIMKLYRKHRDKDKYKFIILFAEEILAI